MQETKYRTATASGVSDAYTGYYASIVPTFPQGVDKYNRIGNRISWKYLQLRLSVIFVRSGGTATTCLARIILFQTRTDLVPPTGSTSTNVWPWLFDTPNGFTSSIRNQNVRVLMDKTRWYSLTDLADVVQWTPGTYIKKKFPIRNNVNFADATELVPSETKDQIYLAILTNRSSLGSVNISWIWQSRISFYDL